MKAHDRLRDEFYAQLVYQLEARIGRADAEAKSKGLLLNDSQVRSALLRAVKVLKGQNPAIPQGNERDAFLAQLVANLIEARADVRFAEAGNETNPEPVSETIWCNACEAVVASVNIHKIDVPGSRNYLDYLGSFLSKVRSAP
jgi:hypothetical protein